MKQGTLILICGLPGAGKTTFARNLELQRGALRLCPDDWIEAILRSPDDLCERDRLRDPIENLQWELAKQWLSTGHTVILENGFWAEEERLLYTAYAFELGAKVELVYLEVPDLGLLWRRVQLRNQIIAGGPFVMTFDDLRAAWELFEPPTPEEMAFYDHSQVIEWYSNAP